MFRLSLVELAVFAGLLVTLIAVIVGIIAAGKGGKS